MTTQTNNQLDVRGLNCPIPIIRTKKELSKLESGEILAVVSSDPGSVQDMNSFCQQTGNTLISTEQSNNEFSFTIKKS